MTDRFLTPDSRPDLTALGELANAISVQNLLTTYQSKKATQTLRRQKADLALFAQFLSEAKYAPLGLNEEDLEQRANVEAMTKDYSQRLISDLDAWRGITWGLVDSFLQWQLSRGYATGSINVRLATIKAYSHLARKYGSLSPVEYAMIKAVSGFDQTEARNVDEKRDQTRVGEKKPDPIPISFAHAALLKRRPDTPRGRRDALLLCLMLDLGLRCGEIRDINVADVRTQAGLITFYRHKVHKTQTHQMTPDTLLAAMAYLADLPKDQVPLFVGICSKGRIDERSINSRVEALGLEVGLTTVESEYPLSPHDCRHYWTTSAFRGGSHIDAIQKAGGWNSPAMPLRYAEEASIANEGIVLG